MKYNPFGELVLISSYLNITRSKVELMAFQELKRTKTNIILSTFGTCCNFLCSSVSCNYELGTVRGLNTMNSSKYKLELNFHLFEHR